mmetsp:Transcript_29012/g.58264  ORF Transcript_29012/g.58264 Transcript_29012/m.58264 type:complete len:914 (+) Transcript_29012:122-2863(+)
MPKAVPKKRSASVAPVATAVKQPPTVAVHQQQIIMNNNVVRSNNIKIVTVPASSFDQKLGITVEFGAFNGAIIRAINPHVCQIANEINVGDRIISNNDQAVRCIDDLKPKPFYSTRSFGIIPAVSFPAAAALVDKPPVLPLKSITASLKHHVITQIATYLELNNTSSHTKFLTEAKRDFPFLRKVNWESERSKVRVNGGGDNTANQPVAQKAKPVLNSTSKLEEWKRLHSASSAPPKYDFSTGRKARVQEFKKARKEQGDAKAAAETLAGIASHSVVPPVEKAKKSQRNDTAAENPYERSFSTSRRSTVTSKRAAAVEAAAEEDDASSSDSSDDDSSMVVKPQKTQLSLDRAARAAKRAAAAATAQPAEHSDPSFTRKRRKKSNHTEDDASSSSSGKLDDSEGAEGNTPAKPASKRKRRQAAANNSEIGEEGNANDSAYDSDEWTPPEKEVTPQKKKITFEERVKLCQAFKVNNGHLNIPTSKSKAKGDDDYGLGKWVETMRRHYRDFFNGELVNKGRNNKQVIGYQLEVLEEIGFDFGSSGGNEEAEGTFSEQGTPTQKVNVTRRVWEYRVAQCRQFKVENGHMNIHPRDEELGNFASRMRALYNRRLEEKEPLTQAEKDKVRYLDELGFAFDGKFDVNLQKFMEFKQRTGESKVPIKNAPDKKLGTWAAHVRQENNKLNRGEKSDYLTADRLRKLATAGFAFGEKAQRETPWEEYFDKLSAYRAEHGKDPPTSHPEMGYWITKQRAYYNKKVDGDPKHYMTDEREEKLRSIGFVFQAGTRMSEEHRASMRAGLKKTFDDRLAEFVAWKEKHGHPYVPTVTPGEDKHLGRWVAKQRLAYKAFQGKEVSKKYGKLTAEQALKLSQAGFAFEASHIRRTPKDNVDATKPNEDQEYEQQNELEWANYEHSADPFV